MTTYSSADHVPEPPDERGEQLLAMVRSGYVRGGCSQSRPAEPEHQYPASWNPTTPRGQLR